MNNMYKVIWHASLGIWIAVSELAKGHSKSQTQKKRCAIQQTDPWRERKTRLSSRLSLKYYTIASGVLLILSYTFSSEIYAKGGIYVNDALDSGCTYVNDNGVLGTISTESGNFCLATDRATQTNRIVFFGDSTASDSKHLTIAGNAYINSGSLGLGGGQTGATGRNDAKGSLRIGGGSVTRSSYTGAGTLNQVSGTYAIAIGGGETDNNATIASGQNSVAMGYNTHATANNSTAIGSYANALGIDAMSFGFYAKASQSNAIALGANTFASGTSSMAFGERAQATNTNAMAFGVGALANQDASIAIGNNSKAVAMNAIALGNNAVANATNSIGIGYSAQVTGVGSVAMGSGANVVADNAVGLGRLTNASLANAVALGVFSTTASNATNITAVSQNGLSFDNFAGQVSDTGRQVSVGYAGFERQIKHVGAGAIALDSTDAVNGSQLFATNAVLGNSANSQKSLLGGNAALAANGTLSMTNIGGTGKNTIHEAILAARNSATAGSNIVVTPRLEADGSTSYQIATDPDLKALNSVETIDGTKKTTMTAANTLIEDGSNITTITAQGTSVTDGSNSSIYAANGLSINGNDIVLNSSGLNVAGVKISHTGIDANGKIMTNVANGQLATDAVNLSQLDKAIDNLTNNYQAEAGQIDQAIQNIAKSLGANAAYDAATGGWTAPSYTVTTNPNAATTSSVNNVADALTGLNSAVNTPLSFTGDSGSSSNLLGSSLAINGDTNLSTVVSQGKAQLKLNADLKGLNSVETIDGTKKTTMTAANTLIEDDSNITTITAQGTSVTDGSNSSIYTANGLSINGSDVVLNATGLDVGGVKISKDGINANNQVMSHVAQGVVDSDATNLGQVKSLINGTSSSLTDLGFALKADDQQMISKKLGEAIEVVGDGKNISTKINNNQLQIQLADQLNVASINAGGSIFNAMGLTVGNSSVNANGIFIVNGPSLSTTGIDAGNKVISQVADGQVATDAVNKGQLDTAINNLKDNVVNQVAAGSVQYDKNPDGSVNKDSITLAGGSNGTLISHVADGQITAGSKDAINGGQLASVQDNLQSQITQNTQNINQMQNQFNNGSIGLVQQNDIHADITVAQQTGGTRVNVAGIDGDRVISGVKDGQISAGSNQAVTGGQLYSSYENMAASLGGDAKYENGSWTAPTYHVGSGENQSTVHNVGDAINALNNADSALNSRIDTLGSRVEDSFRMTNNRIDKVEKHANAGIASALAIEAPAYVAGKFTYAVGAAGYRGEGAVGISLRRTAEKGNWSMTMGVAADSQGSPAFRIGVGGVIN